MTSKEVEWPFNWTASKSIANMLCIAQLVGGSIILLSLSLLFLLNNVNL